MSMHIVDNPSDRPEWIRETARLVTGSAAEGRRSLLHLVDEATDADLLSGTPDDWGLGQVAVHLLVVERGVSLIALRLARGEDPGQTGQPRPDAAGVTRAGIHSLADKAALAGQRLLSDLPASPDTSRTATHPFYGELNCFGWLLTIASHYSAHLQAWHAGRPSAL